MRTNRLHNRIAAVLVLGILTCSPAHAANYVTIAEYSEKGLAALVGVLAAWFGISSLRKKDNEKSEDVSLSSNSLSDLLRCSVFAPAKMPCGSVFLVQVFVHDTTEEGEVQQAAKASDAKAKRRASAIIGAHIELGETVAVQIIVDGCSIDEPVQEATWLGAQLALQFAVGIPSTLQTESILVRLIILRSRIPIGNLKFVIEIADKASPLTRRPVESERYRNVFVSYSSEDRDEVVKRLQLLPRFGIEFFQDVFGLEPGDEWDSKIYSAIDASDSLFLFWSRSAQNSEAVEKEWKYALSTKGISSIQPIPIEGPPLVPPPPELQSLHFNDKLLYFIGKE